MPDMRSPEAPAPPGPAVNDQLVDTVLAASRALVAVAARSLAAAGDEVTLPQYRALVVLAAQGPQGTAELAAALAVNPSTATRMCDRLVRKGLVRRHRLAGDRRAVRIALTEPGRNLVADVSRRRRAELARLLGALPAEEREPVIAAFRAFAAAAGWVIAANIAADLAAWTRLLGHHDDPGLREANPGTLRYRVWHLPARLARHARQRTLAISPDWPWAGAFLTRWQRLSALPAPI